jgi:alpha,alpha-trehalase
MQELRKKIANHFYRAQINLAPKKDSPDELLGELFQDVQLRRLFPDSMTFVDMVPAQTLRRILRTYRKERHDPGFDLRQFVKQHFQGFIADQTAYTTNPDHSVEEHIEELWGVLRREVPRNAGSLIGLPHPYVVCGGRYIAQFYWDSYFIMLGLAAGGHWDMVENITRNCAFMIRKYGFVPNGNRTYYTSRSQPPMFALMVRLLAEHKGKSTLVRFLPHLYAEYTFWMRGTKSLHGKKIANRRVVRMPDGSILNRYYDSKSVPRPEGYQEDVEIALTAPDRTPSKVYLDLRAGAESAWDYGSRWLRQPDNLGSIHTTDIVPVDLNSLLVCLEETLAESYAQLKQNRVARHYRDLARRRREAINKYCWNKEKGFYFDYDFVAKQQTSGFTLAGLFPLFTRVPSQEQADEVAAKISKKFLQKGGVVTSLLYSGQQWDWPNGWAPLQWVTIQGLRNYGHTFLADEIKQRWTKTVTEAYKQKGKLVEKYNVVDTTKPPQAGEYALPDGFGWTNGVLLALLKEDE